MFYVYKDTDSSVINYGMPPSLLLERLELTLSLSLKMRYEKGILSVWHTLKPYLIKSLSLSKKWGKTTFVHVIIIKFKSVM